MYSKIMSLMFIASIICPFIVSSVRDGGLYRFRISGGVLRARCDSPRHYLTISDNDFGNSACLASGTDDRKEISRQLFRAKKINSNEEIYHFEAVGNVGKYKRWNNKDFKVFLSVGGQRGKVDVWYAAGWHQTFKLIEQGTNGDGKPLYNIMVMADEQNWPFNYKGHKLKFLSASKEGDVVDLWHDQDSSLWGDRQLWQIEEFNSNDDGLFYDKDDPENHLPPASHRKGSFLDRVLNIAEVARDVSIAAYSHDFDFQSSGLDF